MTPEDSKTVLVLDANSGALIHAISPIGRPHALLYRPEVDRLYITDGEDGAVKVFDGSTYKPSSRIGLLKDADAIGFDISRKYLYVVNGGGDIGQKESVLSVIDTATNSVIKEIKIGGDTLEAIALDNYRPHIYINDKATNHVVVLDRFRNQPLADWPITLGRQNVAMALDEQRQRLFVGCRSGQVVVLDSNTGKELQALPIATGIDDLIYDPASRRLYAAANGQVDVFEQKDLNTYVKLGSVPTGINSKTAKLVPQIDRLFVAVPQAAEQQARVLVFKPVGIPAPKALIAEEKESVDAPRAEEIVLETLSAHPLLRRVGLHAIPPGGSKMVIVGNGNATRIGIPTSEGDFAAVKDGKIYGPKIVDGQFYNMKMLLFDAQHRQIGILVMEIACTDALSEDEAAKEADAIRHEISQKIPDLRSLFTSTK